MAGVKKRSAALTVAMLVLAGSASVTPAVAEEPVTPTIRATTAHAQTFSYSCISDMCGQFEGGVSKDLLIDLGSDAAVIEVSFTYTSYASPASARWRVYGLPKGATRQYGMVRLAQTKQRRQARMRFLVRGLSSASKPTLSLWGRVPMLKHRTELRQYGKALITVTPVTYVPPPPRE